MVDHEKSSVDVEENEINLLDLVAVIVKRKKLILTLTCAAAIISIVFSLFKPTFHTYTATVKVIPPQKKSADLVAALSTIIDQREIPSSILGENLAENAQICAGILKSSPLEGAVIRRLDLTKSFNTKTLEGARRTLEGMVKIEVGKDNIISIAVQDKDPKRAAAVTKAFVEELNSKCVQLNLIQVGSESIFLAKMLDEIRKDLQESEVSLKSFQNRNKDLKINPQVIIALNGVSGIKWVVQNKEMTNLKTKAYPKYEDDQIRLVQDEAAKLQGRLAVYERRNINGRAFPDSGNASVSGVEGTRLINELKTKLELFEVLVRQYRMASLAEARNSSLMVVLDETVVSTQKSNSKRYLGVVLSTVTSFFIGIFLAFILEYAEKMPDEDKARWREIKNLARTRK